MCQKCLSLRNGITQREARKGFFGTKTRVQPRLQSEQMARNFDAKVRQIQNVEENLRKMKVMSKQVKHYVRIIDEEVEDPLEKPQKCIHHKECQQPIWKARNSQYNNSQPIIIIPKDDICQAGFAGDDAPCFIPSIIGRARCAGIMVGFDQKDAYVGDEAQSKRGVLTLKYPIQQGVVASGDDFEKLLHHIFFNELRIDPIEHPVLIMDSPLTPLKQRERMCQMLFETFLVPALYQISTPVMAAYGCGKDTALIVEGNMSTTVVAPVIRGCIDPAAVVILPFGEEDIVMFMQKLLTERGYSFTTTAERDIVRNIVQGTCHVNANPYVKGEREKF